MSRHKAGAALDNIMIDVKGVETLGQMWGRIGLCVRRKIQMTIGPDAPASNLIGQVSNSWTNGV